MITAYHAGRLVDLYQVLSHELMNVPISIAQTNGMLRSGNKAIMQDVLTKDVECPPQIKLDKSSAPVMDGLWWQVCEACYEGWNRLWQG